MDDDLATKLLSAESDFLAALQSGAQMVSSYRQTWSQLLGVLPTGSKARGVNEDTLCLVHAVASRIMEIANCCVHVKRAQEDSTTQLRVDRDSMIRKMEALDINDHPESSDCSPDVSSSALLLTSGSDTGHSSSPFLAPAYQWLLDNLHNPYPTADVKKRLAYSSSCQISSINSWFTNTRRRIGWTTLCRERFSSRRADMLDAAHRALVEEDPQRVLSAELRHAFVAVKVAAEDLYSSTFTRSDFVEDLDAIVKDITSSSGSGISPQVEQTNPTEAARDSYPSPDRSTPVPVLDDSLTSGSEVDDLAPLIITGSKRRRPSTEPVNQPSLTHRPIKRLRVSNTSPTCLPSPPRSTGGTDIPSVDSSPEIPSSHSVQPETSIVSSSHEQQLSEVDTIGLLEFPCGAIPASRPQVVDTLSRSNSHNEYSVDGWFNVDFDALFAMPPPVEAAQPDSSTLWDVELFRDYTMPGDSKHVLDHTPAQITTHTPLPTDFTDFDHLLQSIGEHAFTVPSETAASSEMPAIPYSMPLSSSLPDPSQISIDWSSLLNSVEAHQSIVYPTFPQYAIDPDPLPEIDLSMLQLPPVVPTADTQADAASKRAKLQQFQAMQEALRRMERELQSEGVLA